jgi:hypothetical protein
MALDTSANGTSTVILSKPFKTLGAIEPPNPPLIAKESGPWSRDAFDLFTWRPPGWNEYDWCLKPSGDDGIAVQT